MQVVTSIVENSWLKLPIFQCSLYEDWRANSVWKLSSYGLKLCIDHILFFGVCFVIQTQAKSSLTLSLREAIEI